MAISDADFAAWCRRDVPRTVLIEQDYGYESGGAPATGTLYLSDTGYNTAPTDNPPSRRYRAAIKEVPKVRRAIDRRTLGGRATLSVSDLRLVNLDGELDFLLDIVIDGYETRIYLGAPEGTPGWTRADFRQVHAGVAERVMAPNDGEIVIRQRDKRMLLNRQIVGNQVGGSGPEANQFLPLLYGSCFNVEARLYDAANATYSVISQTGSVGPVQDVRDSGVSLAKTTLVVAGAGIGAPSSLSVNAGTDVFTFVAHGLAVNDVVWFKYLAFGSYLDYAPFAGVTSGQQYWVIAVPSADTFQLSTTKGGSTINVTSATYTGGDSDGDRMFVRRWYDDMAATGRIQLSSSATGRVTVDLRGATASTGPFAFMKDLALAWGKITSAEVDSSAFTAADSLYATKIGTAYHNYAVLGRENLLDVLDRLSLAAFGWVGISRTGTLTCGLVDVSGIATATATRTLTTKNLKGDSELSVENEPVGIGRTSIQYNRNYTVQTDGLATSVSETNRRKYANAFGQVQRSADYSGTAYSTNKAFYHKTMVEGEPVPLGETSDYSFGLVGLTLTYPTGIADEIVADALPHRQFITARARLDFYDVELGEVVRVTYPRYGMSAGVNARVIGVELDLTAQQVDLDLVRQSTPNLSGSYS